ncbi:MAG TPA: heparinase II/III family protein [Gemmatimonadaceae bacterium]|nr:heparinase II/III family protein [Gemmatimonadaceae bacterium]
MSLLLAGEGWTARREAASGLLAPLADALASDLEPLVARAESGSLHVPAEKALLSRIGGRCPDDGELLDFDPASPHEHRCPRCGRVWRSEWHDRYWPYWYQMWLAERAVHGALLYRLRDDARHRALARTILARYVAQYLDYPNRDNVLGPSRPFFSTYLESIWLLQLAIAIDLLDGDTRGDEGALLQRARDRIVAPSVALIASYDEGMSNRQVWNNAALLAGRTLLGDQHAAERATEGASGLLAHLAHAMLPDGTWYEGENYHLFAHRGLWYAVTMLEARGVTLPPDLVRRFDEGFAAPFLTALPDLTLPSRRDSQYAIALRQPRFAELCELGLARRPDDDRLLDVLRRLYDPDAPAGDTGRARTTADVERNRPGARLTRADLAWRALLHAPPRLPERATTAPASVLLEGQGIAIFRRAAARRWVALDYGHSGGGHGHPDRLDLLLADGGTRWLDDMGTGSYVERALHWYRSTLAHNAPLVNGRSQRRVHGRLLAYEERGGAGWVSAEAAVADGVTVRRTVVVLDDYLLDRLEWEAAGDVEIDLPVHLDGETVERQWERATLRGGDGAEDGFDFVADAERTVLPAAAPLRLVARQGDRRLDLWMRCDGAAEWWRACAPGPPGRGAQRFHLLRARGRGGRVASVYALGDAVDSVRFERERVLVRLRDGSAHAHAPAAWGWHVDLEVPGARSSIDLGGLREPPSAAPSTTTRHVERRAPVAELPATRVDGWLGEGEAPSIARWLLGREAYVRSEPTWEEAGRPTAVVSLAFDGAALVVEADVATSGEPTLVPEGTLNPYDNEPPEINGDGIQLYVHSVVGAGAWVVVPVDGGSARARRIAGWSDLEIVDARWRRTPRGYTLRARVPMHGADGVDVDVVVNDIEPGRQRRRGQLVLSGGGGFVYLRGDRHPTGRLLGLRLIREHSSPRR